jgi:hypothetical protein
MRACLHMSENLHTTVCQSAQPVVRWLYRLVAGELLLRATVTMLHFVENLPRINSPGTGIQTPWPFLNQGDRETLRAVDQRTARPFGRIHARGYRAKERYVLMPLRF